MRRLILIPLICGVFIGGSLVAVFNKSAVLGTSMEISTQEPSTEQKQEAPKEEPKEDQSVELQQGKMDHSTQIKVITPEIKANIEKNPNDRRFEGDSLSINSPNPTPKPTEKPSTPEPCK